MKNDKLQDALSHISDKHIAEAAAPKKRRYAPYIGAIAACLALVITLGIALPKSSVPPVMENPQNTQPSNIPTTTPTPVKIPDVVYADKLLASPVLPEMAVYPLNQENWNEWRAQEDAWRLCRNALHDAPVGYADSLVGFWKASIPIYLSDNGENTVYSPISLYMALAMLAQTTGGESQQEILDLLGAESMEALARQALLVFKNQYENDGVHTSILANSLWLDDAYVFNQDAAKQLADTFYASVYQGALETPEMNIALKDWLNVQTGGLLEDSIYELDSMDALTALVIANTINYRCKWLDTFNADKNTQDIFYGTGGEQTVTFMHKANETSSYVWGKDFTATSVALDDGSRMWLILPDEGYTPEDLLASGNALDMIFEESYSNKQAVTVNLSLPKFDVSGDLDLMAGLQEMGITQVTDRDQADFSGICAYDQGIYLGSAQQGIRVSVDEDGLTGIAYTILEAPGKGMPSGEEVDFVLDRPFLFVVESGDGLPLFAGIVNKL